MSEEEEEDTYDDQEDTEADVEKSTVDGEEEEEVVEDKPLTNELVGESLSLLCKTGSGLAHAYVRMDVKDRGLTDVTVLKSFVHVRYVDLSGNALDDISSLGSLPHLLTLKADNNKLTSAALPELQYLQIASFSNNRITTTEGIAHPLLEFLDLSSNKISGLTGLNSKNIPCLRLLDLHANQLESLSGINLPTLQKLYVASNKLTQCEGIQGLNQLTTLHLRDNKITTLNEFVPSLAALQYLNLRSNSVENLSEISKLKSLPLLRALVLMDNPIFETDDYRLEVCLVLRQLERLDKEEFTEDERAEAEEFDQQRQQESVDDQST